MLKSPVQIGSEQIANIDLKGPGEFFGVVLYWPRTTNFLPILQKLVIMRRLVYSTNLILIFIKLVVIA